MSPTTTTGRSVPTLGVPAAPPLPDDLEAVLRRLRLPHIRRHAPEVIATAKAQRWEPLEVLRALFAEEAAGREPAAPPPGSPPAKPSPPGTRPSPRSRRRPSRRCGPWSG